MISGETCLSGQLFDCPYSHGRRKKCVLQEQERTNWDSQALPLRPVGRGRFAIPGRRRRQAPIYPLINIRKRPALALFIVGLVREGKARRGATRCRILRRDALDFLATQIFVDGRKGSKLPMGTETSFLPAVTTRAILRSGTCQVLAKRPAIRRPTATVRATKSVKTNPNSSTLTLYSCRT